MNDLRLALMEQKASLVQYLTSKLKAGDWHAVQDAASDIREIDAKLDVLREVTELHLRSSQQMVQNTPSHRPHDPPTAAESARPTPPGVHCATGARYDVRTDEWVAPDGRRALTIQDLERAP